MKEAVTEFKINKLISGRWSPRAFSEKSISDEDLMKMFEAARWAPSAMNEQPWEFIAVKKENKENFIKLLETLNEGNHEWAKDAAVLMIVTANKKFAKHGWDNKTAGYSTGHAVANLTTQAMEQNIYIHQMGGFSQEEVRKRFDISDEKEIIVVMALGYLGDPNILSDKLKERELAERKRKSIEEFVRILK